MVVLMVFSGLVENMSWKAGRLNGPAQQLKCHFVAYPARGSNPVEDARIS